MKENPVRLAIVGSGNIVAVHSAAISQTPEALLVAVCSRNAEAASELAKPTPALVFPSVGALIAVNVADALLIATPSGAHAESVPPALHGGLHVLCEKPHDIRSDRVRAMISEAEQRSLILAGFFLLRCGAGVKSIRRALEAERNGLAAQLQRPAPIQGL